IRDRNVTGVQTCALPISPRFPSPIRTCVHLSPLLDVLRRDPEIAGLSAAAREGGERHVTIAAGARIPVLAGLANESDRPLVVVTATGRETDELAAALESFVDPDGIAPFPAWETLPHERLSPRSDTVARRLPPLRRLAHPGAPPLRVVILPERRTLPP